MIHPLPSTPLKFASALLLVTACHLAAGPGTPEPCGEGDEGDNLGVAAPLAGLGAWLGPASARADNGIGDGLYGRLNHDLFVQIAAGGGLLLEEDQPRTRPLWNVLFDIRARMTGVAGVVLGGNVSSRRSSLFLGAEVRPLYPALVLQGLITGRARADLTIQSLYIELGAVITLVDPVRTALGWGLGFEVPIVLPQQFSQGVWIRFGVRHHREARRTRDGTVPSIPAEWLPHIALAMTFGTGNGHFAGWEPPRNRP